MGKKAAPPPAPDLVGAAKETAAGNAANLDAQTLANRPNQVDAQGNSIQWTKDPVTGQWSQKESYSAGNQDLYNKQMANAQGLSDTAAGLLGRAQASAGQSLDLSSLPALTGYDMSKLTQVDPSALQSSMTSAGSLKEGIGDFGKTDWSGLNKLDPGFGAVQEVSDAMMGRMAPLRQQQRDSELQRLQNQGLSANSEAYQRALRRLDMGDTDANQQALLAGMTAYGDIFNRGLSANQQEINRQFGMSDRADSQRGQGFQENVAGAEMGFGQNMQLQQLLAALRGQEFGEQGAMAQLNGQLRQQGIAEQKMLRDDPYDQLMKLQGQTPADPTMPSFMGAGYTPGADILGATNSNYQNQLAAVNAKNAASGGMMSGLMGLAGSVLGGPVGAKAGGFLGGLMK